MLLLQCLQPKFRLMTPNPHTGWRPWPGIGVVMLALSLPKVPLQKTGDFFQGSVAMASKKCSCVTYWTEILKQHNRALNPEKSLSCGKKVTSKSFPAPYTPKPGTAVLPPTCTPKHPTAYYPHTSHVQGHNSVPQHLEIIMFGMSPEDLWKPASVSCKEELTQPRNQMKLSQIHQLKPPLASLWPKVPLNREPARQGHPKWKTIWKGISFYLCQGYCHCSYSFHPFTAVFILQIQKYNSSHGNL